MYKTSFGQEQWGGMPEETQRAYTIRDKPVCHLWRANESDKIDINDLHQRTGNMGIDYLKQLAN